MNCAETRDRLDDYVDGLLPAEERVSVEAHLQTCAECRQELDHLRALLSEVEKMPRYTEPPRDLWSGIAQRIQSASSNIIPLPVSVQPRDRTRRDISDQFLYDIPRRPGLAGLALRIAAAVVITVGSFWLSTRSSTQAWKVAQLEGTPTIGSEGVRHNSRLEVGEWLETDQSSRARINIADIGEAEIGPNSRLRLLATNRTGHRLELMHGDLKARVSAPPRIFVVDTPSATAVDLGCAYDLFVNEAGNGTIHVTSGEVSLEFNGHESFVPTGSMCETRRGLGPGTPYSDLSTGSMRELIRRFDFEKGGSPAALEILRRSTNVDAITLWHLLSRVDQTQRGLVFDRFASLIPPPNGVTREGVMRLDKNMLEDWLNVFAARSFSLRRVFSSR